MPDTAALSENSCTMRQTTFGRWYEISAPPPITFIYLNIDTMAVLFEKPAEWREHDEQERQRSHLQNSAAPNYTSNVPQSPPPSVSGCQNAPLNVQPPPALPSTQYKFAKPTLPAKKRRRLAKLSVGSSPNRLVTPEAANINGRHRNALSPEKLCAQGPCKPHPSGTSRTIAVGSITPDALISSPSANVDRRVSTVTTSPLVLTNSPHLDETNNKRTRQEVGDDTEQFAMAKARDIPATDWRLAQWARFYKPELAKEFREKLQIEPDDGFITMRDASFILERKFIDKLVSQKANSVMETILKHGETIERAQKQILKRDQEQIRKILLKAEEDLAKLEERTRLLEAFPAVPKDIT